jgi:hypothetical protein
MNLVFMAPPIDRGPTFRVEKTYRTETENPWILTGWWTRLESI